jgi:hypothetical protein
MMSGMPTPYTCPSPSKKVACTGIFGGGEGLGDADAAARGDWLGLAAAGSDGAVLGRPVGAALVVLAEVQPATSTPAQMSEPSSNRRDPIPSTIRHACNRAIRRHANVAER